MLQAILETRVKVVVFFVVLLFFTLLFFSSYHTADEELRLSELEKKGVGLRSLDNVISNVIKEPKPQEVADAGVQFYSGKEVAKILDQEKKPFQIHTIQIINSGTTKALLQCRDAFSTFGKVLPPGGSYSFTVTDLFAKRHYWCSTRVGTNGYTFRAYGEGAPRDNNVIILRKDGAYCNGKLLNVFDGDDPANVGLASSNKPETTV